MAAYEGRRAEYQRRREVSSARAAEEALDDARRVKEAAFAVVRDMEVSSIASAALKASIVASFFEGSEDLDADTASDENTRDHQLAMAVVRDLLCLSSTM